MTEQTSPKYLRRICRMTVTGKCARKRYSLDHKRHRNRMRNAEAIRSICQVYSALVPGYFDEVWMWVITAARSGRLDRLGDGVFVHAIGRHVEGADPPGQRPVHRIHPRSRPWRPPGHSRPGPRRRQSVLCDGKGQLQPGDPHERGDSLCPDASRY